MRRTEQGDPRPFGVTTCGFGLTRALCDREATRHIMWLDPGGVHTSQACDEHFAYILRRGDIGGEQFVSHPFRHPCGIAGTYWWTPFDSDLVGYCYMSDKPSVRTIEAVESWLAYESPE